MKRMCVLCALVLVLGAAGCSEKDKSTQPTPDPVPTYLAPTSPENVLRNLESAYIRKDIDAYDAAIGDGFMFYSNASDAVPFSSLTEEQDRTSTLNMFNAVEEIDMQLVLGTPSDPDIAPYSFEPSVYRQLEVVDVAIRVQTREGAAGDPLIYLVQGDVARFILAKDETVTPATYSIVYQADLGSARLP